MVTHIRPQEKDFPRTTIFNNRWLYQIQPDTNKEQEFDNGRNV